MPFAVIVELPAAPKVDVKLGRCLYWTMTTTSAFRLVRAAKHNAPPADPSHVA